tara:strand:+ start:257 stop:448 length:192 start_codon:yes stop_codon:yes gene_type:complete
MTLPEKQKDRSDRRSGKRFPDGLYEFLWHAIEIAAICKPPSFECLRLSHRRKSLAIPIAAAGE